MKYLAPASAVRRPLVWGVVAAVLLLAAYFSVLSLVSGIAFTLAEFGKYWYFVLPLAALFGMQVGMFTRLRALARSARDSGTVMAASGTTSTAAMISCCAHYLANVAPVLGATGLIAFASQFQVEFFWVGLLFALGGIAFIWARLRKAEAEHAQCAT